LFSVVLTYISKFCSAVASLVVIPPI